MLTSEVTSCEGNGGNLSYGSESFPLGRRCCNRAQEEELFESLVYHFPERKSRKNARKKTPYAGPSTFNYAGRQTFLGFTTTLSSSDEEQEAGARFEVSEILKRREERNAAAA